MDPTDFWNYVDELTATHRVVYGYLENTTSADGAGIDVWVCSAPEKQVTGLILTVDLWKRDMEVKLLIGCVPQEVALIQEFFTTLQMGHTVVSRGTLPAGQS